MILYGLLGINTNELMLDFTIHSDENSDNENPNWIKDHDITFKTCTAEEIHPVVALFFFTFLNGIGSPNFPYHSYFEYDLGDP